MSLSVTYTESPNTVIRSARWNRNFDDVEDWANAHEIDASGVHGVTGNIVGTTDTQTLTNKTLTSPTINGAALSGTFSGNPTFSGNVSIGGTLGVTGATTLSSTLAVTGNATFDTNVLFVDATNDKVGIGITSSLLSSLHIRDNSSATQLCLANSTGVTNCKLGIDSSNVYRIKDSAGTTFFSINFSSGATIVANSSFAAASNATVGGTLGVTGATTLSSTLSVPTATKLFLDGGSNTSIRESAADVLTMEVGGSDRLSFNSSAVTANFMSFSNTAQTTGNIINIPNADSLTTGSVLNIVSNSSDTSTRSLVSVTQSNASASGAACLSLSQAGAEPVLKISTTGNANAVEITTNNASAPYGLSIARTCNTGSTVYGLSLDVSNSGGGPNIGIAFQSGLSHVFYTVADATDPTGGGGAAAGRIPISIGGATRYLAYY